MRLTTFSDYSLRVLIYLGLRNHRLSTIREIAAAYDISRNHLMKVVHHLASGGHVETVRGKGGGLRLARPPGEIRIGEVVRQSEQGATLVECFDPATSRCRIQRCCRLQGLFAQAAEAFFQVLDGYTLADLLEPREALQAALTARPHTEAYP